MSAAASWDDLALRLVSGLTLAVIGGAAVIAGGQWLIAFAAVAGGAMTWELATMTSLRRDGPVLALAVLAAAAIALPLSSHQPFHLVALLLPAAVLLIMARRDRAVAVAYALAIAFGCYGVVGLRIGHGLTFALWLVLVVVATDILGYFGGRLLGGPKFWPRISPKKTWSGTVSGWVGAAIVGIVLSLVAGAPAWLAPLSVLVSFASQMGDIAESAIKRRAGVKDSSALIPGHGGLMDRFDGMIGAGLFLLAWGLALPLPLFAG